MLDLSYTKSLSSDELNNDTDLRNKLIQELDNTNIPIYPPINEASTHDLLVLYETINKIKNYK